jgi:hypothetical protein
MGDVIQFPGGGDLESRRTVRALERLVREYLSNGPQLVSKVRLAAKYISEDEDIFDEAQYNLGIRFVKDRVKDRVYLALPGDEIKVPNSDGRYSYLELRREG